MWTERSPSALGAEWTDQMDGEISEWLERQMNMYIRSPSVRGLLQDGTSLCEIDGIFNCVQYKNMWEAAGP